MENNDKENLSRKEKKAIKKAQNQQKEKMNPADKKGIALIVLLAIIALLLFGKAVKTISETTFDEDTLNSTSSTFVTTTTQPSSVTTTLPDISQPESTTQEENQGQNKPSDITTLPQKDEKQEILDVITKGVNSLKASDASFTGHKEQVLDMELTECTVPGLVGIVNKILDMFIETEVYDYDFTNGKGIDPEYDTETTTMDTFPPAGENFTLTIDGVASAKKEQQGENTVYEVKLVPEKSTKDNPKTAYHENACDTLDLSNFELPMGEITTADLNYSGATVSVTLDKNGKVVGYHERLEIVGTGEAAAIGMSGGGTVEGYIDETWTIQWK